MDNVSFHKSKIIKETLKDFNVIYTPPYSPQFNPIEFIYSIIKRNFKFLYIDYSLSTEDFINRINKSMTNIDTSNFKNIFKHSLRNV